MKKAVFAGSFDPVHFGHIEILETASQLFDQVYWILAINSDKKPMFRWDVRFKMMEAYIRERNFGNVTIDTNGLFAIQYAQSQKAQWLVRSMRNGMDFEYEKVLEATNRVLDPTIQTIYLPTSLEVAHVSSTVVRELFKAGYHKKLQKYVPACVLDVMYKNRVVEL